MQGSPGPRRLLAILAAAAVPATIALAWAIGSGGPHDRIRPRAAGHVPSPSGGATPSVGATSADQPSSLGLPGPAASTGPREDGEAADEEAVPADPLEGLPSLVKARLEELGQVLEACGPLGVVTDEAARRISEIRARDRAEVARQLMSAIRDAPDEFRRRHWLGCLLDFVGPECIEFLTEIMRSPRTPELRRLAAHLVSSVDAAEAAPVLLGFVEEEIAHGSTSPEDLKEYVRRISEVGTASLGDRVLALLEAPGTQAMRVDLLRAATRLGTETEDLIISEYLQSRSRRPFSFDQQGAAATASAAELQMDLEPVALLAESRSEPRATGALRRILLEAGARDARFAVEALAGASESGRAILRAVLDDATLSAAQRGQILISLATRGDREAAKRLVNAFLSGTGSTLALPEEQLPSLLTLVSPPDEATRDSVHARLRTVRDVRVRLDLAAHLVRDAVRRPLPPSLLVDLLETARQGLASAGSSEQGLGLGILAYLASDPVANESLRTYATRAWALEPGPRGASVDLLLNAFPAAPVVAPFEETVRRALRGEAGPTPGRQAVSRIAQRLGDPEVRKIALEELEHTKDGAFDDLVHALIFRRVSPHETQALATLLGDIRSRTGDQARLEVLDRALSSPALLSGMPTGGPAKPPQSPR